MDCSSFIGISPVAHQSGYRVRSAGSLLVVAGESPFLPPECICAIPFSYESHKDIRPPLPERRRPIEALVVQAIGRGVWQGRRESRKCLPLQAGLPNESVAPEDSVLLRRNRIRRADGRRRQSVFATMIPVGPLAGHCIAHLPAAASRAPRNDDDSG